VQQTKETEFNLLSNSFYLSSAS